MLSLLRTVGWIVCVVYATIPLFWLMIHPWADYWRARADSPYRTLVPVWVGMWVVLGALTAPWRSAALYNSILNSILGWFPAAVLFAAGNLDLSAVGSALQLGAARRTARGSAWTSRAAAGDNGIRARVRHPVYLGHLCEMLAWSVGAGLIVCWVLTGFAVITGAFMIKMEDDELGKRFGEEYERYRSGVPAILPRI